jgi:hypothetical protein
MPAVHRAKLIWEIHRVFAKARERGLEVWLTGGWGIEAQVPAARRPHEDVDVAVALRDLDGFTALLQELGHTFPPERQSPLRPEGRRGEIVVQGAGLKFGSECTCMSVRHMGEDRWLRSGREWFPPRNDWGLGGTRVRCAKLEALLVSKLSALPLNLPRTTRILYEGDVLHLLDYLSLTREEAREYEEMAVPIAEEECAPCCPWDDPRFGG